MHDQRHAALGAEPPPAFYIAQHQGILDIAHYGRFFELFDDGQHRGQSAVGIEIVLHLEAGWCHILYRAVLLKHVVVLASVHLEQPVALVSGADDFAAQLFGIGGPRPRRHGHAVAHLGAHQLVGRHFEILTHHVVQGPGQAEVDIAAQKVEGAAADEALHALRGRRRAAVLAPAYQAVVSLHLEEGALVNGAEAHGVLGVASGERHMRRNDVNIGNFHGCSPRRVSGIALAAKLTIHRLPS